MKSKTFPIILVSLFLVLTSYSFAGAKQYVYLFGSKASFIKIDVESNDMVDLGNLWWTGIRELRVFAADPARKSLFVDASINPFRATIPTRGRTEIFSGLFILKAGLKGSLELVQELDLGIALKKDPVRGLGPPISSIRFSPDGKLLYVSWSDEKGMTGIFDAENYRKLKQVPKKWATKRMCFSDDGTKVYVPWTKELLILGKPDYEVLGDIPVIEKVGKATFFSKTIGDVADCKAIIRENAIRPSDDKVDETIYIYDIETDKIVFQMKSQTRGNYQFLPKGHILFEEKKDVPDVLPNGKVIGTRPQKLGRLHVYDWKNDKEITVMQLPKDGKRFWVSPNGEKGYYLTPRFLTIIDLKKYQILKSLEIPFLDATIGFLDE